MTHRDLEFEFRPLYVFCDSGHPSALAGSIVLARTQETGPWVLAEIEVKSSVTLVQDRVLPGHVSSAVAEELEDGGRLRKRRTLTCPKCGDNLPARAEKLERCAVLLAGEDQKRVLMSTLRCMLALV